MDQNSHPFPSGQNLEQKLHIDPIQEKIHKNTQVFMLFIRDPWTSSTIMNKKVSLLGLKNEMLK